METRFEQQLKKGVLEMVVLRMICQQPAYGYELILRLRAESDGLLAVKEGTLYPILYRLEDDGLIAADWQTPADQPAKGRAMPKKTYTATPAGRRAAARQAQVWQQFAGCIDKLTAAPLPGCEQEDLQ
ncbi:MAG: helix-turn-helix transcriptional regulator [Faecalibacterium sp.]|nr:helix-turn-helix transcriptional regulator [Faecalibacterium sp.]